ncbi:MAG: glutaredoxin domain-containing protein [bacterium]
MKKKLTVYSTPTCPYCIRAKEFLRENGVEFEDIDVSSDRAQAQKMIELSQQRGVPVLDFDGQIVVGFDKEKIKELLAL